MIGPERRRRWSMDEKLRVLSEVSGDDAVVAEVARRHDITRQHIYQWRREAVRKGLLPVEAPRFLAIEVAPDGPHERIDPCSGPVAKAAGRLEVALRNGRIIRLGDDVDDGNLARLIRIVEAA
nr:transposase [Pinisolibacter aquiterrae]